MSNVSISLSLELKKLVATAVTVVAEVRIGDKVIDSSTVYTPTNKIDPLTYIVTADEYSSLSVNYIVYRDFADDDLLGKTSFDLPRTVDMDYPVTIAKMVGTRDGGAAKIPFKFLVLETSDPVKKSNAVTAGLTAVEVVTLVRAVTRIQRVFRALLKKIRDHKAALQRIWTVLDWKEESELAQGHGAYEKLKGAYKMSQSSPQQEKKSSKPTQSSQQALKGLELLTDEFNSYVLESVEGGKAIAKRTDLAMFMKGCEIPMEGPVELTTIRDMVTNFQKGQYLDYMSATHVLRRAFHLLSQVNNVNEINIPKGGSCVMIGDIHGQLADLIAIINQNGYPSESNIFLFNGDIVDRGQNSMECLLTILALKIYCPEGVHVNRGNHESKDMNSQNGFEEECWDKYDGVVFDMISSVFGLLPLCSVVQNSVFVVHAGLTAEEDVTIKTLNLQDRYHTIPPRESLMEDFLWSDPDEYDGITDSPRGAGVRFGPDISREFRQRNNITLILRSHECVDNGYEAMHDCTLFTVFSASNYCGDVGNLGAVCVLKRKEDTPHKKLRSSDPNQENLFDADKSTVSFTWKQWYADDEPNIKLITPDAKKRRPSIVAAEDRPADDEDGEEKAQTPLALVFEKKVRKSLSSEKETIQGLESKILEKLRLRLSLAHTSLTLYMNELDQKEPLGFATLSEWEEVMAKALQMDLPYGIFQRELAGESKYEDKVNVKSFLDLYKVDSHHLKSGDGDTIDDSSIGLINNLLFSNAVQLKAVYRYYDDAADGKLTVPEFRAGLESLVSVLAVEDQITEKHLDFIISKIPREPNGQVNYHNFLGGFQPKMAVLVRAKSNENPGAPDHRSLSSFGAISAVEVGANAAIGEEVVNAAPFAIHFDQPKEVTKKKSPKKVKKKVVFHYKKKTKATNL